MCKPWPKSTFTIQRSSSGSSEFTVCDTVCKGKQRRASEYLSMRVTVQREMSVMITKVSS